MTEPTITCPNCKTEIRLSESLADPLPFAAAAPGSSGNGSDFDDVPLMFAEAVQNAVPGVPQGIPFEPGDTGAMQ